MNIKKFIKILLFANCFLFIFSIQRIYGATFSFSPANETFQEGCLTTVDIMVDPQGENSNAADIEIFFDPTEVEIIDSDPAMSGIQLKTGDAYETYFGNQIDETSGIMRLAAGSFMNDLTSKATFATLQFKSKSGVTSTTFEIYFDGVGATLDSNIADTVTSDDLLTNVTNGNYSFVTPPFGSCENDTSPPDIIFIDPQDNAQGVPSDSDLEINITDDLSGIDLASVEILLNGELYRASDFEVIYTGDSLDYSFTVDPRIDNQILENQANSLIVRVTDYAGNSISRQIVFNVPLPPPPTPFPSPTTQPTGIPAPTPTPCVCEPGEDCEDITITICHMPGTPSEKTMEVSIPAISSHLDHGDYLGSCDSQYIIPTSELISVEGPITAVVDNFESILETIPVIGKLPKDIRANVTTFTVITTTSALSLFALSSFLNAPNLLINLLGFLLGRKHKKPWGIVLDASNDKPVPYAICRLFNAETLAVVDQTLTDSSGQFGFAITHGKYRLEISKSGYEKFKKKFTIEKDSDAYIEDIKLLPMDLKARLSIQRNNLKNILKLFFKFFQKILPYIFVFGLCISIISLINGFNLTNLIITIIYIFILGFYIYTSFDFRTKYSAIIDSSTSLRLPNALIKIFNPENGTLIDTKLTNNSGYFDFWGKPGTYYLTVSLRGYRFPSEIQTDIPIEYYEDTPMAKVKLTKGNNKLKILVDPIEE
ncbi:hypothetical protein GF362_05045 [Candidatus Dojkabacteria bacterium]|nr:hypothetical protein [Candidatus Dojkabacteria bacterium]